MEEQGKSRKRIYTKKNIIDLYTFFFIWGTVICAVPCFLCKILPHHHIIYCVIQGIIYYKLHKHCKYCIDNNIDCEVNEEIDSSEYNYHKKITGDDFGSTATNSWRIETNLYSGSSLTSSSNTYILNNIINKTH